MVTEGDLTVGGEYTIQYADDILWNCAPDSYIILLTTVTPINSLKINTKQTNKKKRYVRGGKGDQTLLP